MRRGRPSTQFRWCSMLQASSTSAARSA
jgi:hypothetical protein